MNTIAVRILCVIIGSVFGCFQTAYFYGKAHGIDIRQHGSGNVGTTNTLRVLGNKAGLIVLIGDCLKTMLPILIVKYTFGNMFPEMRYLLVLYTAAGAILGHDFPFYMNFKGGKGIAATAGLIFSTHYSFVLVGIVMFFGPFFTIHIVSVGSILVYVGYLTQLIIMGQTGFFAGYTQAVLNEMYILTFLLMCLAIYQHRSNIVRLIHGEEKKVYLSKKNKEKYMASQEEKKNE